MDSRDGAFNIFYKKSTDGGISWSADIQLTNYYAAFRDFPSIAVFDSVVYIVWHEDTLPPNNYEIFYKKSTDFGVTWGAVTRLTNNDAISQYPSIAVSGSVVHVVWHDNRDGNWEIYYKRSTNGGVSWEADYRLINNIQDSFSPSIAVSGSIIHVVWQDKRDGNMGIYYKQSSDGGLTWGLDTRLPDSNSISEYPSVAISGSTVHVVWRDLRDSNWEIYYKRNPTGNPTGIENLDNDIPLEYRLLQNYPNPFSATGRSASGGNPSTTISWQSAVGSWQTIKLYNALGEEIDTIVEGYFEAGKHSKFYILNSTLPSGVYFYQLRAGDFVQTKKMILMR